MGAFGFLQLSFDQAPEREYRIQDFHESIRTIRFGMILGILLYGLFGILDEYMLPVTKDIAWFIRFAIVLPVLIIVLVMSFRESFVRYATPIIFSTSLILGYGILAMIYFAHPSESGAGVYYTGLMLVIIWIGTFSQLRFYYAASSITILILGFLLTSIFRHHMIQGGFANPKFLLFINNSFFFLSCAILAFVSSYSFEVAKRNSFRQRKRIEEEKQKSDTLLLNILPESVAEEIKAKGVATPQVFSDVTVLMVDIIGFTELSGALDAQKLVGILNEFFTACDNIIEKNKCERIKTIGDAYMAVAGMPMPDPEHAIRIATSALEIIAYCKERNRIHEVPLYLRIGIHSGSVVGAVVGIKKYIYDIFGSTINVASRMQAYSEPMKINITETTCRLIHDQFNCVERDTMPVKGLGDMKMFFLEKPHPPIDTNALTAEAYVPT